MLSLTRILRSSQILASMTLQAAEDLCRTVFSEVQTDAMDHGSKSFNLLPELVFCEFLEASIRVALAASGDDR